MLSEKDRKRRTVSSRRLDIHTAVTTMSTTALRKGKEHHEHLENKASSVLDAHRRMIPKRMKPALAGSANQLAPAKPALAGSVADQEEWSSSALTKIWNRRCGTGLHPNEQLPL